jgi:xylose isomerase
VVADKILTDSPYKTMRAKRYASFDSGKGAAFEADKLTLEELAAMGAQGGEPDTISGKQELYEALINQYI